jgi:hypothetical protein
VSELTAQQRILLARLAMDARKRGVGWASAVARASVALQEAGVEGELAWHSAVAVHGGLPSRWIR